jgi:hypothetical protein
MSSYIVKYITLSRVASYLAKKRGIVVYESDKDGKEVLSKKMKKLISDLWDLNVFSLNERYGEETIKEDNNEEYIKDYVFEYQRLSENEQDTKKIMLFFKSFCNYTYQSCEGKAEKTKLYKECQETETELAYKIAYNIKEWNEGEWE